MLNSDISDEIFYIIRELKVCMSGLVVCTVDSGVLGLSDTGGRVGGVCR